MNQNTLSPETNELEDLESYRSFSGWAVIAFLFSALGLLSIYNFYLWPIPVVGLLLGIRMFLRERDHAMSLMARSFCFLAVALAVFILSYQVVENVSYRNRLYAKATEAGLNYLNLLKEGKYDEAYNLTFHPTMYFEEKPSMAVMMRFNQRAKNGRIGYINTPAISMILSRGANANWKPVGMTKFGFGEYKEATIEYIDESVLPKKKVALNMMRVDPFRSLPNEFIWFIDAVEIAK